MPRQNKVIIWIHRPGFRLTDNWNIRPGCLGPVLISVPFGSKINDGLIDSAPLKYCVPFCRSTINMYFLAFLFKVLEEHHQFFSVRFYAFLEVSVWFICVQFKIKFFSA